MHIGSHEYANEADDDDDIPKPAQSLGTPVDVKCTHTKFGECDLSCFRDITTFKNGQISLSEHGLVHGGQKI